MNDIERFRQWLTSIGITADVAAYAGITLKPGYVYIPHLDYSGAVQKWNRRPIYSQVDLTTYALTQHLRTRIYYAHHPLRRLPVLDYLRDTTEPLILLDSLLDSIIMQHYLASSGIAAQCIYLAHKKYPKLHELRINTAEDAKTVYVTRETPKRLTDYLRSIGAIVHTLCVFRLLPSG